MIEKLTINSIITGDIQSIAFGGEGVLRHQGFVVFVPFTAPGDKIVCRITEVKKSFAKGEMIRLEQASPQRIKAACPYFGTCGGCQIQHLSDEAQAKYKLAAVTDALKRIGHLKIPPAQIVPAHLKWAYRRHITLHLKPAGQGFEAGYIGVDHRSLVVIQNCPIFNDPHDSIVKQLQEFVRSLSNSTQQEGRVMILKNHHNQYILSFQFTTLSGLDLHAFQTSLQRYPIFTGIIVQSPQEQHTFGDPYCEQKLEGLLFRFTPQAFVQNNPEQSTNIYKHICTLTGEHSPRKILDLYCGFGITSLLLSRQGHAVTGIEYNPDAIRFAQDNGYLNHLKQAHFIQGDVEKILPHWLKTNDPDLILMNPPRTGLSKGVVQMVLKAKPNELIYVSCMPATLARDLALLCQNHYEIQQCIVYDMFPQTAHVETLIYLKKKKNITTQFLPKGSS